MGTKAKTAKPRPPADRVVIAYIHPGQTSAFFTNSLTVTLAADMSGPRRIVGVEQEWSSANVSQARNNVTATFLEKYDAEWLWWIDADMAWEHTALEALLKSAHPTTAPIVGGLCFGGSGDRLFPTIYQIAETDDGLRVVRVGDYPLNTRVQCAATGAAFLLIHRTALEAIRDKGYNKTFPWFQETEMRGDPVGEDITFCLRAGQAGIPVHVDTSVHVGHHKSHLLTHELFQRQRISDLVLEADTGPMPTLPNA